MSKHILLQLNWWKTTHLLLVFCLWLSYCWAISPDLLQLSFDRFTCIILRGLRSESLYSFQWVQSQKESVTMSLEWLTSNKILFSQRRSERGVSTVSPPATRLVPLKGRRRMIDRCERDTSCLLGKSNTVAERGEETKSTEGESIQMQPSGFSSLLMKHRRSADVTWTTSSAIQENKKQEIIVTFWPQWCIYVYIIPNGHFFPPPHIIMCDSQTVVHHRGLIKDPLKLRIFFLIPPIVSIILRFKYWISVRSRAACLKS